MEAHRHPGQLKADHFDYPLPDSRIAQFPLDVRDRSKLLIYRNASAGEDLFYNLVHHLPPESLVIFNETRVIHARLLFRKASGSPVELFCLEPRAPYRDHQQAFQQQEQAEWQCLVGNSKKWKSGMITLEAVHDGLKIILEAERVTRLEGGVSVIRFTWTPDNLHFAEVLEAAGKIPLPPYIHRNPVEKDEITYQTIYARQEGSVAAPTAGLHFSEEVMHSLASKNIDILKFILHVGAGTFRPVIAENLAGHEMHAEMVYLPLESIEKLRASLHKPLVAVGTTTTRLLESLYWHGLKVMHGISDCTVMDVNQWDPYDLSLDGGISRETALDAVISACQADSKRFVTGRTSLLIAPGYQFRFPDILITNFHQP
ncbi:MAG: S-adenosylmethionine:tRNA ribosyltransferase-isomerase, partial [Bacteroidales bacterium]|nr:S-adenosylmethionine:tRNA ribosyltransferase-isomerase [Bacteroidales bacterium]